MYSYEKVMMDVFSGRTTGGKEYPCLIPNWDNTPRSGADGLVLHGSTPELFRIQVKKSLELINGSPTEERFIFIKSWNEWAEGNYLEPDLRFGRAYLEVLRDQVGR